MTRAPGSLATYRHALESSIRPELGAIKLQKLSPAHVEKMGRAIRQRGPAANTAKLAHRVLRSALSAAERHGVVHRNVAVIAIGPKRDDRALTDDVLSKEDAEALIMPLREEAHLMRANAGLGGSPDPAPGERVRRNRPDEPFRPDAYLPDITRRVRLRRL